MQQKIKSYCIYKKSKAGRKEEGNYLKKGAESAADQKTVDFQGVFQGTEMAGFVFFQINGADLNFYNGSFLAYGVAEHLHFVFVPILLDGKKLWQKSGREGAQTRLGIVHHFSH